MTINISQILMKQKTKKQLRGKRKLKTLRIKTKPIYTNRNGFLNHENITPIHLEISREWKMF